jgi:uncharacterized membrane protein (DUF373 family)
VRRRLTPRKLLTAAERTIYIAVAALLFTAATFIAVGAVVDLIEGSRSRNIADAGVFVLDRILLMFIIAELLYTLRLVGFGGRILVEPFLFIGLIAVVRRILVLTAEAEGTQTRMAVQDFVIQLGALAGLALVLILAIFLLRRSAPPASG